MIYMDCSRDIVETWAERLSLQELRMEIYSAKSILKGKDLDGYGISWWRMVESVLSEKIKHACVSV